MKMEDLNTVNGFEVIWEKPKPNSGIGTFGNIQQQLFGYKLTKIFGKESFMYLSNTYQDSEYIYELARGK